MYRLTVPPPLSVQVSDGLGGENLRALKNLCYDLIPKPQLEAIENGLEVFNALIEKSEWCTLEMYIVAVYMYVHCMLHVHDVYNRLTEELPQMAKSTL